LGGQATARDPSGKKKEETNPFSEGNGRELQTVWFLPDLIRLEDTFDDAGWRNHCSRDFFMRGKLIELTVTFQSRLNSRLHCRSTIPAAAMDSRVVRSTLEGTPDHVAAEVAGLG